MPNGQGLDQAQTLCNYRIRAEVTQVTGPDHDGDDLPVVEEVHSLH